MKIAISATDRSLDAEVDPRFGRCTYFIVVDPETMEFEVIDNSGAMAAGGAGVSAAQAVVDKNVQALLTGNCGPNAYQVLSSAGIQLITGVSGKIRDVAENSLSYWFLAETYFFQAKLELLTLDLKKAKKSLDEAQKIAMEHGLSQLTERILKEQDILLNQANKWISLKDSTKSVLEFSNLTPLKEQIHYMLKKRQVLKFFKT